MSGTSNITIIYPVEDPKPFCILGTRSKTRQKFITPTTCFEARDPTPKENLHISVLYAEGMLKVTNELYPEECHNVLEALFPYDEPVYPIPVGASVYYWILLAWMTTFYFTYLGRKLLSGMKKKMDLHPEANKFPNLPLYWIQQSRREAELRREVRNTWAWLARRYLLSPNDPLLANVDQVLGLVNWHDFEVSRTTWSLIKVILTVNSLYVKVKRNRKERDKQFEIIKDVNLAKRKSLEDDPVQVTRVFLEEVDDSGRPIDRQRPKEQEKPKKASVDSHDSRVLDSWLQTTASTTGQQPKEKPILQKKKKPVKKPDKAPAKQSKSVSVKLPESEPDDATEKEHTETTPAETIEAKTTTSEDDSVHGKKRRRKRRRRRKKKQVKLGERIWRYFYFPSKEKQSS